MIAMTATVAAWPGFRPDQIVLAGDSAGGYLSLALAERLRSTKARNPRPSSACHR